MSIKKIITIVLLCGVFVSNAQVSETIIKEKYVADTVNIATFKEEPKHLLGKILYRLTPEKMKYDISEENIFNAKVDTIVLKIDTSTFENYKHPLSNHSLKYASESKLGLNFSEKDWSTRNRIINFPPNETNDSLTKMVYGFHPFWMGDSYKSYYFSLLSRVAYFSFNINAKNGDLKIPAGWHNSELIDYAHSKGCKIDICFSLLGSSNCSLFFSDTVAQNKTIQSAIEIIKEKGVDGINLDFEDVSIPNIYDFVQFIKSFSKRLKNENPEYFFSVCLPAVDWSGVYLLDEISDYVDLYIIMGYDFNGKGSAVAGPNAPIYGNSDGLNITTSLNAWVEKGLPKNKSVLGVPYYGYKWNTKDATIPSEVVGFDGSVTYREVMAIYREKYKSYFDSIQSAKYMVYNEGNRWTQLWCDDVQTLAQKYDFVKANDLAGVAIWALGFDNGIPTLWNLLKQKFTIDPNQIAANIENSKTSTFNILKEKIQVSQSYMPSMPLLKKAPIDKVTKTNVNAIFRLSSIIVLIFALFAILGFIFALFDYNVREVLFSVNFRVIVFFVLIFVLIQIILRIFDVLDDKDILFIIGIVLGVTVSVISIKTVNSNSGNPKDLTP